MSGNRRRYLGRNDGTQIPRNIIAFDTESYQTPISETGESRLLNLRLWTAKRCRIEKDKCTRVVDAHGSTPEQFWQFVDSVSDAKCRTWLFAHNIGFDLTQLHFWRMLDERVFTIRIAKTRNIPRNGNRRSGKTDRLCIGVFPFFIECGAMGKHYTLCDHANYFQGKLSDIGQMLGLPKLEMPAENSNERDWLDYCNRDTAIVYRSITSLVINWNREDCGVFKETPAGLALQNFQHTSARLTPNGNSVDILCCPNAKEHKLERDAYFGGRVQCYYVGYAEGDIYKLDCNSLYPFVMREKSYPRKFVRYAENPSKVDLENAIGVYEMAAHVLINSKHNTYPVRVDGEQYHCTGEYWTALCGRELERAILSGDIARIALVQYYSKAPLFREWVAFWEEKKIKASRHFDNDTPAYELAKLILNSLSGKWAQRLNNWHDCGDEIPLERWGSYCEYSAKLQKWVDCRGIAGIKQMRFDGGEPRHSFPLISACIAANAREYMLDVIKLCPEGSVYYSATDSLICDIYAYRELRNAGLIHDYEFGKFKVEGIHSRCRIVGPNWYELDDETTVSGWMGKAINAGDLDGRVDVFERIEQLIETGPRTDIIVSRREVSIPIPSRRGIINKEGFWQPYRITFDPEFSDRLPKVSFRPVYFLDRKADRIGVSVDV